MTLELFGLSAFFAFALGLGVWTVIIAITTVREEGEVGDELFSQNPLFRLILPFAQYFGRTVGKARIFERTRRNLRTKLIRAGKADALTAEEFLGFMTCTALMGAVVGVYFDAMVDVGIYGILGVALVGFYMPILSLNETIKKRQASIRKLLPYTLDLLCLSVEAGLDFTAALNRIADNLRKTPFKDEIKLLSRDLSMGKTRPEALRDMDKRIGLEELTSVVSALVQADELGASLGPTLRIQSRELQRKRFQRAEKKAMQAPVLMLIPLVIFIFPLVFMIIFAPIVLKILDMGVLPV